MTMSFRSRSVARLDGLPSDMPSVVAGRARFLNRCASSTWRKSTPRFSYVTPASVAFERRSDARPAYVAIISAAEWKPTSLMEAKTFA